VRKEMVEEENVFDLKGSTKFIGPLYPGLIDNQGRVIDANHRLRADPNWPMVIMKNIDTDLKYHVAKLVANYCHRKVPPEELREDLVNIAKLSGWSPQRISEMTGVSYSTVMRHLPDEFKDQVHKRSAEIGAKTKEAKLLSRESEEAPTSSTLEEPEGAKKVVQSKKPDMPTEVTFKYVAEPDQKEQLIKGLNMWFLPPDSPTLKALIDYCLQHKIRWTEVVEQALIEFLNKQDDVADVDKL